MDGEHGLPSSLRQHVRQFADGLHIGVYIPNKEASIFLLSSTLHFQPVSRDPFPDQVMKSASQIENILTIPLDQTKWNR
jgi:hypothetical protein